MDKGWLYFAGIATIAVGCSGNASKSNAGASSAGSTPYSSPNTEDAAGAGFGGEGGTENTNEDSCHGALAEVADAWGFSCPTEFCDGQVLASDCSALPGGALKTTSLDCWNRHALLFEISATRRKVCYYAGVGLDEPVYLVGATVWDDEATVCDGSAKKIRAGKTEDLDSCDGAPFVNLLCDTAHPEQNQGQEGTPPKACYNRFGHECMPCCEKKQPDCSNEPDGYPGYECTPDTPDNEAYCSCSCNRGEWACAC